MESLTGTTPMGPMITRHSKRVVGLTAYQLKYVVILYHKYADLLGGATGRNSGLVSTLPKKGQRFRG